MWWYVHVFDTRNLYKFMSVILLHDSKLGEVVS